MSLIALDPEMPHLIHFLRPLRSADQNSIHTLFAILESPDVFPKIVPLRDEPRHRRIVVPPGVATEDYCVNGSLNMIQTIKDSACM